jgi:hypothetical protein
MHVIHRILLGNSEGRSLGRLGCIGDDIIKMGVK